MFALKYIKDLITGLKFKSISNYTNFVAVVELARPQIARIQTNAPLYYNVNTIYVLQPFSSAIA